MTDITLQGVIKINESGDYYLNVPPKPIGTSLPNGLANQVIEEVFIKIGRAHV